MKYYSVFLLMTLLSICACRSTEEEVSSNTYFNAVSDNVSRTWLGPQFWANRLQDWQVANGRIECVVSDFNRNVHVLTKQLKEGEGEFSMEIQLGALDNAILQQAGWAGFRIGAQGEFDDYRDNAVYGKGIDAGVLTSGRLFIGEYSGEELQNKDKAIQETFQQEGGITLKAAAVLDEAGQYELQLTALNASGKQLQQISKTIEKAQLQGNLALVSDFPRNLPEEGFESDLHIVQQTESPSFWYKNWKIEGEKVEVHQDQTFGPIMFAQHTLSGGVLKMTAQMAPVGEEDAQYVDLEIAEGEEEGWEKVGEASIDPLSRTATFRIQHWPDTADIPYRLAYRWSQNGKGAPEDYYFEGTVKKNPVEKEEIVVAAFTGNNDLGFPNNEIVRHVMVHQPDLLAFTGDQLYESVAGYGVQREPLPKATLDYLRKWYLYGWEFKDLLKDIPAVAIPDDHDVYQGNIWGAGGKAAGDEGTQKEQQDTGGYTQPAEWVNMVQRTQTSHLPDPYDPTPVDQSITVYYTGLHYGGISFAIIEDRKWKSAPKTLLPAAMDVENGWAEGQQHYPPEAFQAEGAVLLGERQLKFLNDWAADWSDETIFKSVISQTIFSTVATLPDSAISDVVVPTLRITEKGKYPENDQPTQDMDSNGWPKQGRDKALRAMRKGFAFHIAGDQHLASTIHYGVEDWGDAGYAICVPSVSNYFPRRWFPHEAGLHRDPGMPKNTGDFYDGFGNKMRVLAVANPYYSGQKPARLYDRAAGYGIVKFNKNTRNIHMANWPRQVDPEVADAQPYEGWPIVIAQEDNYGKKAGAFLPEIAVSGLELPPVIQVIDEKNKEVLYTIRAKEDKYKAKVFSEGTYTIKVGEPGTRKMKTLENVSTADAHKIISIIF